MGVIRDYKEWNETLWNYFFPKGDENPLLYIDDAIINQVGVEAKIKSNNYTDDFLNKTLLSEYRIEEFAKDWHNWDGRFYCKEKHWDDLTLFLRGRFLGNTPAYFAMLCAIMYIACTIRANHDDIKNAAKKYLGENYTGRVGQLVDNLFYSLHCNVKSFDPDRMTCGTQRNISRMKFHTVLKTSEREDFIDFLEINNLKWEYEHYVDYVNNKLIPALSSAHKNKLISIVKDPTFVPYIKNILTSDLNYGKTISLTNNTIQTIPIIWRYELYFDLDGNPSFYIASDTHVPFAIELKGDNFVIDSNSGYSEYIASNISLKQYDSKVLRNGGMQYLFKNIAQENWGNELFFEKVSDDCYYQVSELTKGRQYLKFVREGLNTRTFNRLIKGWEQSRKPLLVEGYTIYENTSYELSNGKTQKNTERFVDNIELFGIGRWFSVSLEDNQCVYWNKDVFDDESNERIPIIRGKDGKFYFCLERTSENHLIGHIYVSKNKCKNIDAQENISHNFVWNGENRKYYINGWGEVTRNETISESNSSLLKRIIQNLSDKKTEYSDMLLQILYDVADDNGCVNQNKMRAALDFVLGFYNIKPTKQNRKNLIYALRRLGYIVAYYNNDTKEYENQLCPAYLEKTNYFIFATNTFLVKGVYDSTSLNRLFNQVNKSYIRYKRPYDMRLEEVYPEYVCLPDLILFEDHKTEFDGWISINYPVAASLIDNLANMKEYEEHFSINDNGDHFLTPNEYDTPCMITDNHKKEVLLTKRANGYYSHRTYVNADYFNVPIPKHLSRVYCQNKKKNPVCIMEQDPQGDINYASMWFVKGMGRPEIFDLAFCDLNLGIPNYEYLFIVNQDDSGIKSHTSYVEGIKYGTLATDNKKEILKQAIEKLSGTKIDNFNTSNSILLSRRTMYKMKLLKSDDYHPQLILENMYGIIAFSKGKKVYHIDSTSNCYWEIGEGNVNKLLSDVISRKSLNWGARYDGVIPNISDKKIKNIHIINKI